MKKIAIIILCITLVLIPLNAFAAVCMGDGFSIDIPEGSNVYYLTPSDTNMTGDILAKAKEEQNLEMLIGVYNDDGYLAYTLKLYVEPPEDTAVTLKRIKTEMAADYDFGEAAEEQVAEQQAMSISGDSLKDLSYAAKVYVLSYDNRQYVLNIVYRTTEAKYLEEVMAQIKTLTFGTFAAPTSTLTPTLTATPTPQTSAPTRSQAITVVPLTPPTERQEAQGVITISWELLLLILAGGVGAALVIAVIVLGVKHKNLKNENRRREEELISMSKYEPLEIGKMTEEQDLLNKKGVRRLSPYIFDANVELLQAYELKKRGDYIFAAKRFHEVARCSDDSSVKKAAELQIVECLIAEKQYSAALEKAERTFYKDYAFTIEERMKLKSLISILKRK